MAKTVDVGPAGVLTTTARIARKEKGAKEPKEEEGKGGKGGKGKGGKGGKGKGKGKYVQSWDNWEGEEDWVMELNGLVDIKTWTHPIEKGGLPRLETLFKSGKISDLSMMEEATGSAQAPRARTFAIARRKRLTTDLDPEEENSSPATPSASSAETW